MSKYGFAARALAFGQTLALLLTPLGASAQTTATPLGITVQGPRGWEMICHVKPVGENEVVRFLTPDRPSLQMPNARTASCAFTNHGGAPLTVTIVAPASKCPLKSDDASQCVQTFRKGAAGSFELKP